MQRKLCSPNLPIDTKRSCYYSIRVQPPVVSESVAPLHVTTQDTLYLASCFPPANFVHSQIPVSERCLDDAARVNPGAEPFYMPIPFPYGLDNDSQSANNILSTTNNPCQSYGRYANNDQSCDFLPSSSTGMEYCDERYQQWLESLDPNTYSIIPHSILSNHDASTTFHGNSYNDIMLYAEIAGTALGSDGTTSHFPNYDANNPHSYYM